MHKALLLSNATEDVNEIVKWYESLKPGLGRRFLEILRKTVRFLAENPNATVIRYDNIRTARLEIFPYLIHYMVDESAKTITIVAVLHTSRNPDNWHGRRKI